MDHVKIVLVGIGGYGGLYVNALLNEPSGRYVLEGCVDPYPERCARYDELTARQIPIYYALNDFYREHDADLAVISTPIHLHYPMILEALANRSNVLCEKPLCGDERLITPLLDARDQAGRFVAVGFQWSHAEAMLAAKRDLLSGLYGRPVLLKTLVLWPRDHGYYARGTGWAGKLRAADGTLIRDSVANNAAAHYLFNPFFMLGDRLGSAKMPDEIESQTWCANAIETFDTAELHARFRDGGEVWYAATHASDRTRNPVFEYRFEKGTLRYDRDGDGMVHGTLTEGRFADGTAERCYGNPFAFDAGKLFMAADNILNGTKELCCGIEAAAVQVRLIAAIHAQNPRPASFPAGTVHDVERDGKVYTVCDGLSERLIEAYEAR